MRIGGFDLPLRGSTRARGVIALVSLLSLSSVFATPAKSQFLVRLQCSAEIEVLGDSLLLYGLIMTDVAVSVDYEIEVVSMSTGNLGSASQGGTLALEAGRPQQTSTSQISISADGGYYEIKITATDRLTGATCSDSNTFVL